MSDDIVNIEVDGQPVEAKKGQMVIEATDAVGAYVPRFCYHEKLSIAANCRMCLVEVEKAPKPLPACATPVGEGMRIFTKSAKAIAAQKATMEFLLINHPLDCPICDQGGECELQDLAMGYGRDISRYNDGKRVVKDKDIGPLVSTDMTRCIHCTRCVRFGEEITGMPQLGTTERGENMQIGTYIENSIDHEMSANIIDLCPVGALNNKPYRYSARAWEMVQRATVSPHDCVGSNMYAHVLRGTVKRIVPKENESINETWLADRDRYSYEAIYSSDRLQTPRIKESGEWRELAWEEALAVAAERLKDAAGNKIGILASPSVTIEEAHLVSRIAAHLGTANIDHRIERRDFTDQDNDPVYPWLGCNIADIESQDAILVIGSNMRREAPILAHRLRKAALAGATVSFASSEKHEYFFDVADYLSGAGLVELLSGVAVAAAGKKLPASVEKICNGVKATQEQKRIAASLKGADSALVLLGNIAIRHAAFGVVRALAASIAAATGARFGGLSQGANSAGAHLAGVLPHRGQGGASRATPGADAGAMLDQSLDTVVLLNVEPDADLLAVDDAVAKLKKQDFVVALTPFTSDSLLDAADLLLPVGTFAETSGTYVNIAGTWQGFAGVANPVGEARPAWKVLRVIGTLLEAADFDYVTSEDVRNEIAAQLGEVTPDNSYAGKNKFAKPNGEDALAAEIDIPIYAVDGMVRRATALQLTPVARRDAGEDDA
ncbi:MAG: NADH-quinone oxidoreductase subunit NuoG [Gammaproteobacteria bacterium]|nr:NADH-quinone oxidoreductase subunit NuoG [Gammaproteobacteria bacterium]MDH3750402.1 NADH-quinone oxidoreductase subunit NuoG [Gammaproteobacteria bacterium]MDH3806225.1 NADH-quinone oxidoreductase subunit NuoG [Gammaproteobacteria bacterium]